MILSLKQKYLYSKLLPLDHPRTHLNWLIFYQGYTTSPKHLSHPLSKLRFPLFTPSLSQHNYSFIPHFLPPAPNDSTTRPQKDLSCVFTSGRICARRIDRSKNVHLRPRGLQTMTGRRCAMSVAYYLANYRASDFTFVQRAGILRVRSPRGSACDTHRGSIRPCVPR